MKRFCVQFFVTLGVMLGLIMVFIWKVDPFFHYHEPKEPLKPYMNMPVYQTAGAAKNFVYDSAIVGTSMTENFRISWFEEMGLHTAKLSYSGARSSDIRAILERVYLSKNQIKCIIIDVNDYQLSTEPTSCYTERPAYLYNEAWWRDGEYLLNNDVFWMSAGRVLEASTHHQPLLDDAYTWESPDLFSGKKVLDDNRTYFYNLQLQQSEGNVPYYDAEEVNTYCLGNLNNIIPVIVEHPETEFIIFYPPYSMLYWQEQVLLNRLDATIDMYQLSIEELLKYDNVRIFYFQDEEEIISNLDNYRDTCHHNPQINRYIFECIKNGDNQITKDSYEQRLQHMYQIASDYPYQSMWDTYDIDE